MSNCNIFTDEYPQYNEDLPEEACFCNSAGIPAHEDMYDQQTYIDY